MGREATLELLLPLLLFDCGSVKWWAAFYFNICSGQEYPAVVEFAPFQKISKKKLKKKDAKAGSIEEGTEIYRAWAITKKIPGYTVNIIFSLGL